MSEVSTVGIDLAKNVFSVHGVDAGGVVDGAPTSTPVGLTPTERASHRWTHNVRFRESYAPEASGCFWAGSGPVTHTRPRPGRSQLLGAMLAAVRDSRSRTLMTEL